jgi:mono/diheme cytochrome c family protein
VIATVVIGIILQTLGAVILATSGIYNIAADQPHFEPVAWFLKTASAQSVRFHSRPERVPNLSDASLVKQGFVLCRKNCQPCHGAPGVANDLAGRGINPKPPPLADLGNDWDDLQLFWTVSHGLKMSGMPAFDQRLSDRDRWATVAFLRRVVLLSPADYARLAATMDGNVSDAAIPWVIDTDLGFQELQRHGNPARGRTLLSSYGCGRCHEIAGIASGRVGPPLSRFAERQHVAGLLVNTPVNLVAWIRDPKRIKAITAMPNLNVTKDDAADLAAYLYTRGSPKRLDAFKRAAGKRAVSLFTW